MELLNQLAQVAQTSSNQQSQPSFFNFVYMKLNDIRSEDGITYAYGIDLIAKQHIRVRLNTIEEGAQDLLVTKRASNLSDARMKITNLYTGKKSRPTLEQKKSKQDSKYLYFERGVVIYGPENIITTYRAHWCYSMSQQEDIEVVIAHIHIGYRPQKQVGQQIINASAYAESIQFMREFSISQIDNNLKMLHFALMNATKDAMREGVFHALIKHNNNTIAEFKILQRHGYLDGTDYQGNPIKYLSPLTSEESIAYYLNKKEEGAVNSFTLSKDIGRVVLHVFCGYDLQQELFASSNEDYINRLHDLKDKLVSGEYTVTVFGSKIYRFGTESIESLIPKGAFNPLIHYSRKIGNADQNTQPFQANTYVPTLLVLHKIQNNRRYIAYHNRLHYNVINEGKPILLSEFNSEIQPITHSVTAPMLLV
jgi:hypothetical protein